MDGGRAGVVRFPPGFCDVLIVVPVVAPLQISFFSFSCRADCY